MKSSTLEKRRLRAEKRMRKDFERIRKDGAVQFGVFVDTINDMKWYQRVVVAILIAFRKLRKSTLKRTDTKDTKEAT